jgi:hypothetical protein
VRSLGEHLGVVYARLPGEAWDLGAGYAVGRVAVVVSSPFDFLNKADSSDQKSVPTLLVLLLTIGFAGVGMILSWIEYSKPLRTFRAEAIRLAKGEIDVLSPSKFIGTYKKIASDLNDGMEKVASKGGSPRRADLEQVLGPIPAQPAMSAFSVPGPGGADDSRPSMPRPASRSGAHKLRPSAPSAPGSLPHPPPSAPSIGSNDSNPGRPKGPPPRPPGARPSAPMQEDSGLIELPPDDSPSIPPGQLGMNGHSEEELSEWRKVYEDFLTTKKQCGEPTSAMSFDKFKGTLERNKSALVARHNCTRVKFTVYVKEGKAALKASPVK